MKKIVVLPLLLLLLLCSCGGESVQTGTETDTDKVTDTAPVTLPYTDIQADLSQFDCVYDEELDADWLTYSGVKDGLFLRIVAYSDKDASLRLICTEADKLIHGSRIYEIPDGSVYVGDDLLKILTEIADDGDCYFNNRAITDAERTALSATLKLYKSSYAYKKQEYKQPEQVKIDGDGNYIYDNGEYSIKFPSSFYASCDNGVLTVISGLKKLRAVSVAVSDTAFSANIADEEAVKRKVESSGGTLLSSVSEVNVGGAVSYRFAYEKNGAYITQFYVDGKDKTYVLTAASYDKNDRIPTNIISTFKLKNKGE